MGLIDRFRAPRQEVVITSITAAGVPIVAKGEGQQGTEQWAPTREDWQARAWEMYDEIGEVRQAARSMGDAFARVPWFVGVQPDPNGVPIPLVIDDGTAEGRQAVADAQAALPEEYRYTDDEARTLIETLDELKSPLGGQSEIKRQLGTSLFVPGECFLVGTPRVDDDGNPAAGMYDDTTTDEDEPNVEWNVKSTEEIEIDWNQKRTNSNGLMVPTIKLKTPGKTTQAKELPVDTVCIRIWRPHPRSQRWADSPMRAALPICEELLILTRAIRGAAVSRIVGPGVWILPRSMTKDNNRNQQQGDGQASRTNRVVTDILEAAQIAIRDPASAASQVPLMFFVDDDLLKDGWNPQESLVQWDRTVDEIAAKQREELLTRLANAIDWPAELLLGKAGLNHWTAFLLRDEAFQNNVEPFEILAVDAVTNWYLRPVAEAKGIERTGRFVVWYSPAGVVSDPDKADKAMKAHGAILISDASARRDLEYTEDDAPDEEERRRRLAESAFVRNPNLGQLPQLADPNAPLPTPGVPSDGQGAPPAPPGVGASIERRALLAREDPELTGIATTLADLDRALLTEVQQRADDAMRRALERANARLRTLAQRHDKDSFDAIRGIEARSLMVAPTLGPATITRLATVGGSPSDDPDLLAGAFVPFLDWYDGRVARSAEEVVAIAASQGLPPDQQEQATREFDDARDAAVALLGLALAAAAAALLLRPAPSREFGEDDGLLVPPAPIRESLARAGGGGAATATGAPASSMMTSDLVRKVLYQAGLDFTAYRWRYGDPSARRRPFQPHLSLNGMVFGDPDDDRLGNAEASWPGVSHYWPGDHSGCLCMVELVSPVRVARFALSSAQTGG